VFFGGDLLRPCNHARVVRRSFVEGNENSCDVSRERKYKISFKRHGSKWRIRKFQETSQPHISRTTNLTLVQCLPISSEDLDKLPRKTKKHLRILLVKNYHVSNRGSDRNVVHFQIFWKPVLRPTVEEFIFFYQKNRNMNRWDFERTVRPHVPLGSITLPGLHLRTRFGERTRFSLVQKNLLQILLKIITDFAVPQKRCKALKILGKKVESSDAQGRLREKDDRCTCHVRLAGANQAGQVGGIT
jgi:hypothetical protein